MPIDRIFYCIDEGIKDLLTFQWGMRPLLNEKLVQELVTNRFEPWWHYFD